MHPTADPELSPPNEGPIRSRWPSANPPVYEGALIGRSGILGALERRLEDGARLVTLVGIGGVGKTRLAAELARQRLGVLDGRVAYVSLDAVTDPALLLATVSGALGSAAPASARSASRVAQAMGGEPALLVLDRLEHLRLGVGVLTQLLELAPAVAVVATSRVPLGLPGEVVVWVEPLPVPGSEAAMSPEDLARNESAALFTDRARSVRPDFVVTPSTAPAIASICRLLDGIPLAIELAAAALRVLSPHQMLDELALPSTGQDQPGGGPGWQRGLRATMDWSQGLLPEPQQRLYRRLSVMAATFDVSTVASLLEGAEHRGLLPLGVPLEDGLGALAAASLLRTEPPRPDGGSQGYRMLTTVRADALERLERSGEATAMRWAHAYMVLALAEDAEAALPTDREREALDAVEAIHDDAREALDWALEQGNGPFALRLGAALAEFWRTRGHHTEGRLRLGSALALAEGTPPDVLRRAITAAALLASYQGDYALSRDLLVEALAVARSEGDEDGEATVLNLMGTNEYGAGDLEAAERLVMESLEIRRRLGDESRVAVTLNALGGIHHIRGRLEAAHAAFQESLEIKRRSANENAVAVALTNLGLVERDAGNTDAAEALLGQAVDIWARIVDRPRWGVGLHNTALLALDRGDLTRARELLDRAAEIAHDLGDRVGVAYALADGVRVDVRAGDLERASAAIVESLRRARSLGSRVIVPLVLEGAGSLATARGDDERAVRVWAAASADRARSGFALMPADRRLLDAEWAIVRGRTGDERWNRAWSDGWAAEIEDISAEVLDAVATGTLQPGRVPPDASPV
jgi:predicted ATPase